MSDIQQNEILSALKNVMDPDLGKNIVDLGFIKGMEIKDGKVSFDVELTTPACPVKEQLHQQCVDEVKKLAWVKEADVRMTARGQKQANHGSIAQNPSIKDIKNIVAVASGKGGVGKSTSAVNIAFALAQTGAKVGLLDADIYGPSVPLMTGATKPTKGHLNMVEPPQVEGIKIISVSMFSGSNSANILRGPMAANVIKQFLSQVHWGELDYLIIDYPPGTGDIQLTLSQIVPIDAAVVVTTPQEVALIDVRKAVSMFDTLKVPVAGVIETMSYFICDGCDKKHYIFSDGGGEKTAENYGVPYLGGVPIDPKVVAGADSGKPVVKYQPDSIGAGAYIEIAGNVVRQIAILQNLEGQALNNFNLKWKVAS